MIRIKISYPWVNPKKVVHELYCLATDRTMREAAPILVDFAFPGSRAAVIT